jgi:hypothetical protein
MILGIVGSEGAKFTAETEIKARELIRKILAPLGLMDIVCSGKCPLGGIDIWAIEEAKKMGFETLEFPPKVNSWAEGYKPRNIQIAKASDMVVCISVLQYPESYKGMKFSRCYHHNDESNVEMHIKSGGCWTTKYTRSLKKPTQLIVV